MIIHPHLLVHGDFTTHESLLCSDCFLTVPPYDPDSQLGLSSLCRLEAATGMEVIMPIVERLGQFNTDFHCRLEAAGMRLMIRAGDKLMALVGGTSPDKVKITLQFLKSMEPKTWRTLYSILNVLDIEGVIEEIESYLSSKCQWEWVSIVAETWDVGQGAGLGEEVGHEFPHEEMVNVHGHSHPALVFQV